MASTTREAKSAKAQLAWKEVDPETLQSEAASAYNDYKSIRAEAKVAREKFEKLFTEAAGVPSTHRLAFSYRFGKLSLAIELAETKKTNSKCLSGKNLNPMNHL
jgi:hypothetical protein